MNIILGLGTNIGDRKNNLDSAIDLLQIELNTKTLRSSKIYESEALLPDTAPQEWQKNFLNMAILIETSLNPELLLKKIKYIEGKIGRKSNYPKWSPRIIDIDILLYGQLTLESKDLVIPHSEFLNRDWCIIPAAEIYPQWRCNIKSDYANMLLSDISAIKMQTTKITPYGS